LRLRRHAVQALRRPGDDRDRRSAGLQEQHHAIALGETRGARNEVDEGADLTARHADGHLSSPLALQVIDGIDGDQALDPAPIGSPLPADLGDAAVHDRTRLGDQFPKR
jgi:hypothetical protein